LTPSIPVRSRAQVLKNDLQNVMRHSVSMSEYELFIRTKTTKAKLSSISSNPQKIFKRHAEPVPGQNLPAPVSLRTSWIHESRCTDNHQISYRKTYPPFLVPLGRTTWFHLILVLKNTNALCTTWLTQIQGDFRKGVVIRLTKMRLKQQTRQLSAQCLPPLYDTPQSLKSVTSLQCIGSS
jgi:hypothetical protein